MREVVGAIIRNTDGEYLLQLRDDKAPRFKNCWTLFGGQVEEGESPETALGRELDEELCLRPDAIHSMRRVQLNSQGLDVRQSIFEVNTSATLASLTLGEGADMAYVPEETLFDREFAFNIREVLAQYIHDRSMIQ